MYFVAYNGEKKCHVSYVIIIILFIRKNIGKLSREIPLTFYFQVPEYKDLIVEIKTRRIYYLQIFIRICQKIDWEIGDKENLTPPPKKKTPNKQNQMFVAMLGRYFLWRIKPGFVDWKMI